MTNFFFHVKNLLLNHFYLVARHAYKQMVEVGIFDNK